LHNISAPATDWRCGMGRRARGVLLLGGAAMDGPRYLFWNFVAFNRESIAHARLGGDDGDDMDQDIDFPT
jgi:hypothetical protein